MKTLSMACALILVVCLPVAAQADWMQVQNLVQNGQVTPTGVISITRSESRELGWFGCASIGPNYAEGYAGPTVTPRSWMQVGAGAGLEQGSRAVRLGAFAWIGAKGADLLFIAEDGGNSGRYLKLDASYRVMGVTSFGWYHDYFLGGGPSIKLTKPLALPVIIWGAALDHASIVAIRYLY